MEHLRAFLGATAELAPSTLARKQAALRSCFGWAYREGLIDSDPAARLEKVKVPRRDPRPLTEEQAEALLAAIPSAHRRNRLLFSLLYETGMRVGEALGIHVGHVHQNATARLREGVSLQAVRKLMGHKNLQTTLRYAETDMESIKQELAEARRRSGRGGRGRRG